jgi:rod shape-determining protein MreC
VLPNQRGSRRLRLATVLVFVLLGVAFGMWHNRTSARRRPDPITSSTRTVTTPLVGAVVSVREWFGRQTGWLLRGRSLARENVGLRTEVARLREENARLHEADNTVQRLRRQLGFQDVPVIKRIAADVLAIRPNPSFETLVIHRGSRDGVRVDSVVVAPEGVVGHVYDVAPTTAAVLLVTDANSAVGAMVQRAASRAVGVCHGTGGALLTMSYLDQDADVRVGDTIVSSGMGAEQGVFPKGLVIGTVTRVGRDAAASARLVLIRPAVDVRRLEEVYVLR